MKRVVFLVDETKREEVKQLLDSKGIQWFTDATFHWDWRTAFCTLGALIILGVILIILTIALIAYITA